MLMENGNAENPVLQEALETLVRMKRRMLKNPDMIFMFTERKELTDDKETMKLAKAQAKQMLKQMKLDDRKLSIAEMKKAQLIFTSETGKGSRGQLLTLLLVKLWEFLKKKIVDRPAVKRPALKRKSSPRNGNGTEPAWTKTRYEKSDDLIIAFLSALISRGVSYSFSFLYHSIVSRMMSTLPCFGCHASSCLAAVQSRMRSVRRYITWPLFR